jgi:hypothetical protein
MAFSESMLRSFVVPAAVQKIERRCFALCTRLAEFTFERDSSVTLLADSTFIGSAIREIVIPKSVSVIAP